MVAPRAHLLLYTPLLIGAFALAVLQPANSQAQEARKPAAAKPAPYVVPGGKIYAKKGCRFVKTGSATAVVETMAAKRQAEQPGRVLPGAVSWRGYVETAVRRQTVVDRTAQMLYKRFMCSLRRCVACLVVVMFVATSCRGALCELQCAFDGQTTASGHWAEADAAARTVVPSAAAWLNGTRHSESEEAGVCAGAGYAAVSAARAAEPLSLLANQARVANSIPRIIGPVLGDSESRSATHPPLRRRSLAASVSLRI